MSTPTVALPAPEVPAPVAAPPGRPWYKKKHVIGYTAAILISLGVGGASASGDPATSTPQPAVTVTVPGPVVTVTVPGPVVTVTAPAPVAKAPAVKPAPAPVVAATIEDGQWEVGVDVPAGVYKVTTAMDPGSTCYWSITQTGNPDNIIDNDLVTGGKPTVTLKRGQDFTTNRCGTWTKR